MRNHDKDFKRAVEVFEKANFVREIGIKLLKLESGFAETFIDIEEKHLQQNNFVHAGVQATISDHTAGTASATMIPDDETILSVEFKINLLRPAVGKKMLCRSKVLKPGKSLFVVESEVFMENFENKIISKSSITLAVVKIPLKD